MNLLAGPYDYEFGHELFSFQGRVRHLSNRYDKVTVCTRPQMEFLYEDFAHEFIPFTNDLDRNSYVDTDFVTKESFKIERAGMAIKEEQKFIRYGKKIDEVYDIIFHARAVRGMGGFNLTESVYNSLHDRLEDQYKIAFVGAPDFSYCPTSATDLRGISLKHLTNIMRSARLMVGPSSGPMHLASLCGLPHVVWGGYRLRTFYRYVYFWNPFSTVCYVLDNYESSMDYLRGRARKYRCALDVFERKNVNLVQVNDFSNPSEEELMITIKDIL